MKTLLALALLIAGSHAFAAETHELSCNSDDLTVDTFVTSQNGIDQVRVALVDSQGRAQNLFAQAGSAERIDLQAKGLKLFNAGGDRAIETPQIVMTVSGSIVTLSGRVNGSLQCIDLTSDNPWGKLQ